MHRTTTVNTIGLQVGRSSIGSHSDRPVITTRVCLFALLLAAWVAG